ncbi:hypothetical protein [Chlorogloeopsis sp. ULAP02]|uniref:hypothetical protein n=1 Tax=Chlorogloeopsis sp. ULAP02 TaxID=3107926 RepID=UPI003134C761
MKKLSINTYVWCDRKKAGAKHPLWFLLATEPPRQQYRKSDRPCKQSSQNAVQRNYQ